MSQPEPPLTQIQLPRLSLSCQAPAYFPFFDEDCDNFGFSWVSLVSHDLSSDVGEGNQEDESGRGRMPPRCGFEDRLLADSVFHNPSALDLMLGAYDVSPHHSFAVPHITALNRSRSRSRSREAESDKKADSKQGEEEEEVDYDDQWDHKSLQRRRHTYMSEEFTEKAIKLTRQGKFSESLALLDKALDYDHVNVTALVTAGANQANLGRYSPAIRHFEHALLLDPACQNATKYLESTRLKASQVRDISTVTLAAKQARLELISGQQQQAGVLGSGAGLVLKVRKSLQSAASGDPEWSYVLDEEEEEEEEEERAGKKNKRKRERGSDKKHKKDRKDKKSKSHKKERSGSRKGSKKSRHSRSKSSCDGGDDPDARQDLRKHGTGTGTGTGVEFEQEQEQELHPILSRTKHDDLWG